MDHVDFAIKSIVNNKIFIKYTTKLKLKNVYFLLLIWMILLI